MRHCVPFGDPATSERSVGFALPPRGGFALSTALGSIAPEVWPRIDRVECTLEDPNFGEHPFYEVG
jgi:hypothetical protein